MHTFYVTLHNIHNGYESTVVEIQAYSSLEAAIRVYQDQVGNLPIVNNWGEFVDATDDDHWTVSVADHLVKQEH